MLLLVLMSAAAVATILGVAARFIRTMRREQGVRRTGACPSCGYDLKGIGGPCPECGRRLGSHDRVREDDRRRLAGLDGVLVVGTLAVLVIGALVVVFLWR